MKQLQDLVERLLFEEEGSALDFKREQYPFAGAGAESKSELLKDILAFANAWRRTDAYILVGVREVKGGRSELVGVASHLDDADLQQFVNGKTQRPVEFSYRALQYDSKSIAVIHIPKQERPTYLKRDFGKLAKEQVYIRRGSSTDIARPDEIARMGQDQLLEDRRTPELTLALASSRHKVPEGLVLRFKIRRVVVGEAAELPDYRPSRQSFGEHVNIDYNRELAHYVQRAEATHGFHVVVRNSGALVAHDVCVELEADKDSGILLRDDSDSPQLPERSYSIVRHVMPRVENPRADVWVERRGDRLFAFAELGKVQAGAQAWSGEKLFVGARESGDYCVRAKIFCDELGEPIEQAIEFGIEVEREEADLDRLEELCDERTFASDAMKDYQHSVEERE